MLPDSIRLFASLQPSSTYPLPEIICLGGFLLLLFLERLALLQGKTVTHTIPYMLATILVIHALVEGAALGIGNTISETIVLLIAILAHKGSESFALCMSLLRHRFGMLRITLLLMLFAFMTPIGIGLGASMNDWMQAQQGQWTAAIYNAFAAGTFLYMSTLHHIRFHEHAEEGHHLQEFLALTVGLVVMGIVAIWA
jgi:zinc transporter ZupT